MGLAELEQVRLFIQDAARVADGVYQGDGSATVFALPHRHLTSGTAFVPSPSGWGATGATFDPTGFVAFSGAIAAGSAFRARYVHSTFSDAELEHFLAAGGSVRGAALAAVQTLMFDGLRRARWAAPDGSQYDDTAAQGLLRDLYTTLARERETDAGGLGAVVSW